MRKTVAVEDVKKFKQAWYEATTTGKDTPMTFSGGRSETVTHTTQPHEVGIRDAEHIKDIVAFRNLVFEYNLLFNTSYKYVSLMDEVNINVLSRFLETGVVEKIEPFGAGNIVTIPTRIDDATKRPITLPVVMCKVEFDKEKLSQWLQDTELKIQSQIAEDTTEIVH